MVIGEGGRKAEEEKWRGQMDRRGRGGRWTGGADG